MLMPSPKGSYDRLEESSINSGGTPSPEGTAPHTEQPEGQTKTDMQSNGATPIGPEGPHGKPAVGGHYATVAVNGARVNEPLKNVAAADVESSTTPMLTKVDVPGLEGVRDADLPRNATLKSTVINVANNMLGAGMLTLPWGMKNGSTIPTLVLTFVVMLLCCYSMIIIGRCCEKSNVFSFRDLWALAFSEKSAVVVQVTVGLTVCMTTVSYSVLIGDFLTEIFTELGAPTIFRNRVFVVSMVTVCILAPLGIMRDIHMLRWTSVVSVLAIFYAGCLAIARGIMSPIHPTVEHTNFQLQFFTTQALINVAFTAHYNAPKYYREMVDRTQYNLAIFIAFFVCACLYSAVSVASYFEFGEDIDGNLLTSFDDGSVETLIAKALMAVVIIFTFPLPYYSLRTSFDKVFFGKRGFSRRRMIIEGLCILPFPIAVGIIYPQVEIVIAYKGATFGTLVVYLYPAILFYKICRPPQKRHLFGIGFLIVFGVITGILGIMTTSAETFCFWGMGDESRC